MVFIKDHMQQNMKQAQQVHSYSIGVTAGASLLYEHEQGVNDDQSAMTAFITSGDFDIQDGQQILSISKGIPDFKNQVWLCYDDNGF